MYFMTSNVFHKNVLQIEHHLRLSIIMKKFSLPAERPILAICNNFQTSEDVDVTITVWTSSLARNGFISADSTGTKI